MGNLTLLYGYIGGARFRFPEQVEQNMVVLNGLPLEDKWPFLSRDFFATPTAYPYGGTYKQQIIHFGGAFKGIEEEWAEWLEKFERLLLGMFWEEAHVHMDAEFVGKHEFIWQVLEPPQPKEFSWLHRPGEGWNFSGGPRSFFAP